MRTDVQVKALIIGLKQDVEDTKNKYVDGSLSEDQHFAILHYKNAQIRVLEWVLGNEL